MLSHRAELEAAGLVISGPAKPEVVLDAHFAPGTARKAVFDLPLPWINSHWFDMALLRLMGYPLKSRLDDWTGKWKAWLGIETCR